MLIPGFYFVDQTDWSAMAIIPINVRVTAGCNLCCIQRSKTRISCFSCSWVSGHFAADLKAKATTLHISLVPLRALIDGHDIESNLVFWDNQLAAAFVRLDGTHHDPEHKGWWHLEAGFGKCDIRAAPHVFKTTEGAGAWVEQTLMGKGA